jgi:hypothetical protein
MTLSKSLLTNETPKERQQTEKHLQNLIESSMRLTQVQKSALENCPLVPVDMQDDNSQIYQPFHTNEPEFKDITIQSLIKKGLLKYDYKNRQYIKTL